MTSAQKVEMERLDCTMVRKWQGAKRDCRKLQLGAHLYSKQLSVAQKCIGVWCMVVKHKKGGQVNSTKIKWLAGWAGIEAPLLCTLGEVEHSLWAVELEYTALIP